LPNLQALASPSRLAALQRTGLLEACEAGRLDALTRLAAQILGVPTVVVSLVDAERQCFKGVSSAGGNVKHGWHPLNVTFCQDVIAWGEPIIVADTVTEPLTVGRDIKARAYAGVPLINDEGQVLGTLCAMDYQPRPWTERDIDMLTALASAAMSEIQRHVAERAAHDTQLRLVAERTLAHAVQQQMTVGVVVAEIPSGRLVSVNAQMTEIFRTAFRPAPDLESYREWVGFHDNGIQYSALEWPLARTVITKESVRAEEIRIRRGDGSDGYIRMSSAPVVDDKGEIVAAVAIVVDVSEQKKAERAVRGTDERFKFVAKATTDVIWDWDV
jgi:GAF domain-containing protein